MSWVLDNADWLEEYVAELKDALGLPHWRIHLSGQAPSPDTHGQVQVVYGRHVAHIYLDLPESPEQLRETLVHELLHCHFERMSWAFNNFRDVVGSAAFSVGEGAHSDAVEVTIDALSAAIAPLFPLAPNEIRVPEGA